MKYASRINVNIFFLSPLPCSPEQGKYGTKSADLRPRNTLTSLILSAKIHFVRLYGEMSEWFKELVLKTSDPARGQGFESLSLRHISNPTETMETIVLLFIKIETGDYLKETRIGYLYILITVILFSTFETVSKTAAAGLDAFNAHFSDSCSAVLCCLLFCSPNATSLSR